MRFFLRITENRDAVFKATIFVCLSFIIFFMSHPSIAANLGDMATTVGGQTSALADMVKKIAMLTGLVLIVAAIVIFANMKKTQTPMSIPVAMLVAGIF